MRLRPYQKELSEKGALILKKHGVLYLALEMRVGKTPVSLDIAETLNCKRVLFVTEKRTIEEIQKFYDELKYNYNLIIINYESLHKVPKMEFDLVICDEAHCLGSFPKPNKRTKLLKEILFFNNKKVRLILLSGTPSPESYSQLYHQFWISANNPFQQTNFYEWAKSGFVYITTKRISGYMINDYSHTNKKLILEKVNHLILSYTQEQAEFKVQQLNDEIFYVEPRPLITEIIKKLLKDRVYHLSETDSIVCDTAAKLQQKIHQLSSGTVVATDNIDLTERIYYCLDTSKAEYIKKTYYGKHKIAVYYLYKEEGETLKTVFNKSYTDSPSIFNNTDKQTIFLSQFKSGSKGINISSADIIIFYNIMFSSETYQQVRQRASEKEKEIKTKLHWIFSKGGIEEKIYKRVLNKQSYTTNYFRRDFLYGTLQK